MAKYQITHTCGHTSTKNITGPVNLRQGRADYYAESMCWDCEKAHQNSVAAESNANLPELTGSEKQIAWAESIRADQKKQIDETIQWLENANTDDKPEAAKLAIKTGLEILRNTLNRTSASAWIDSRDEIFGADWIGAETKKALNK